MSATFAFDQLPPAPRTGMSIMPSAEEVNRAVEGAHAQGFAEGREAGIAEGRAQIAHAEEALRAAASAIVAERDSVAERVEHAAVSLALRIAEQALHAAVAADPELVLNAVRGALRLVAERERVQVLVNPEDLEAVRAGIGPLAAELGGIDHWDVQAERRVARGGAVVRTAEGEVDASIEAKLDRAREVLDDELRR